MAIQISGTTVIDNSRNITNFESVAGNGVATQAEAEAGTDNTQVMTPLRVTQAIAAAGGGMVDDDIVWSGCNVGCAVRGGGNVFRKTGGIIWIVGTSAMQRGGVAWPMGYCSGGSAGTIQAGISQSGRDGWFVPDIDMLTCGHACRTYWDSYCACYYWSSTNCGGAGSARSALFSNTTNPCVCNHLSNCTWCARPMRVVCY